MWPTSSVGRCTRCFGGYYDAEILKLTGTQEEMATELARREHAAEASASSHKAAPPKKDYTAAQLPVDAGGTIGPYCLTHKVCTSTRNPGNMQKAECDSMFCKIAAAPIRPVEVLLERLVTGTLSNKAKAAGQEKVFASLTPHKGRNTKTVAKGGDCSVCLKPVPSDGKFMTCGACKSLYHLGSCAGIKESTFGAMGQERREKWRCRSCRSADSSSTQGSVSEEPQGICASEELLSAVNTKLDLLVSLKANVDTLLTLPSKVDELLTLKPAVQCLQERVKTLQQSIDDLSLKYDSVLAKATENEKNTEALQVRLAEVCSVVDEQSRTIQRLQGDLNHLEQRSRSTNLEIHGLPCHKDENLERIIADLGDKLDLPPLQAADVLAIHRLATKPGLAPPVLISSPRCGQPESAQRGRLASSERRTVDDFEVRPIGLGSESACLSVKR
ncbi:uncharacterized protein ISCGN_031428 [Ixodes scapularis]